MARQVTIDILGDAKNFTRATEQANLAANSMSGGMGKASGAAKNLEKDLAGMGKGMAANIPIAGGFGGALAGLPLPALAAAAAIGGLVIAGKSVMEISEKWETAQKGLEQATNAVGFSYEAARFEANAFIQTNQRYVSSQADVVDSYAALIREGLSTKKAQEDLNLALDLSAIKHINLKDATTLLQQVEMGRGRALITLGIQMKEYPILMETATQAAKKLADAEKAVHAAQLAHTAAVKAHGPHSAQAKASADKLAEATKALAVAHNYAADRAKASAEIHDRLHHVLDGGRNSTSELTQAQNRLGNIWQSFAERTGPMLNKALAFVVQRFTELLVMVLSVFDAIGNLVERVKSLITWLGQIKVPNINLPNLSGAAHALHIPGFAAGTDYVPQTMLAVVHQGEQIIPAGHRGGGRGGITINLFATVADGPALDKFTNDIALRLGYATGV